MGTVCGMGSTEAAFSTCPAGAALRPSVRRTRHVCTFLGIRAGAHCRRRPRATDGTQFSTALSGRVSAANSSRARYEAGRGRNPQLESEDAAPEVTSRNSEGDCGCRYAASSKRRATTQVMCRETWLSQTAALIEERVLRPTGACRQAFLEAVRSSLRTLQANGPQALSSGIQRLDKALAALRMNGVAEHAIGGLIAALVLQSTLTLAPIHTEAAPLLLDSNHEIAQEVLSLVETYYYDSSFGGVDWGEIHDDIMSSRLRSRTQTYNSLRAALSKLHDPYTRILSIEDMKKLRKYDVTGVGLLINSGNNHKLVVASDPPESTAAWRAGIRQGDIIVSIDGESTDNKGAFQAAQMMQGEDGTSMVLGVFNPKSGTSRDVELVRTFAGNGSNPVEWNMQVAGNRKVGYVRLTEFSARTRGDVENALRTLESRGANAYAIDLRGNPGGVFEGALEIAGLLEGEGRVVARVSTRSIKDDVFRSRLVNDSLAGDSNVANKELSGRGQPVVSPSAPVVVLVDGRSASSSEVLAGSLRDNCRAVVAGKKHTFGKGLIQGVFGLSDGGGLIVTVASYRTPSGNEIQGQGIEPSMRFPTSVGIQLPLANSSSGGGVASTIDFDEVERQLRMCRPAEDVA